MDPETPRLYPLYNTTFTLHRLSPLYTGSDAALNSASLHQFANSFRDILVGEVLRGVRVGLGSNEDALARVGALQTVKWQLLPNQDIWNTERDVGEETTMDASASRGIFVNIVYERARYSAILLRAVSHEENSLVESESGRFEHFPLLLTRMPGSLRDTFTAFLSSTFDTRASILHLRKSYLTAALEQYILDCSIEEGGADMDFGQMSRALRTFIKDVQIVIGLDVPNGASLKTIDILINKEDLPRLFRSGKKISRSDSAQSPLMAAISSYVNTHLALDLRHENVKILKIACGAFVLGGSEGKLKITELSGADDRVQGRATWNLVHDLVELSKGSFVGKENND